MARSSTSPSDGAASRLKRPLSILSRALRTAGKLGDTDSLADETSDKKIQRAYEKRSREDAAQEQKDVSREQHMTHAQGLSEDDLRAPSSRYGICGEDEKGGAELPSVTLSRLSVAQHEGQCVQFTARVHHCRSMSAKLAFLLFRQQVDTIQGTLEVDQGGVSEEFVRWAEHLEPETVVRVRGYIRKTKERIQTCSIHDMELLVDRLHVVVPLEENVHIDAYNMDKMERNENTGELQLMASGRVRIGNRIIFLRTPVAQSIFRIRSAVCNAFRSSLLEQGFIEIQTPKLQPAATESGAEVFRVNYFGRTAFLAQSPQLAKQMAISSDFGKVFEIGPVFRAENSNTHRHLTEYTGLDLEMVIERDYYEAMDVVDELLKSMFESVYQNHGREVEEVRARFPHDDLIWLDETPRIPFKEGIRLLNESGWTDDAGSPASEKQDLGTQAEIRLGQVIKEQYKTDYYILDKFPASARPFYTRLDADDESITNSFDIFIRGQEITTGGERINSPSELAEKMKEANVDPDSMEEYMRAFLLGVPRHAGCGVGLERLLFLLLDLKDVRNATMFPRDPKSLPARPTNLSNNVPFSEADTIRFAMDGAAREEQISLPELGKLIANYGDSTNTSWLDETFTVWRHKPTGAAIGYARSSGYALIMGNPLCDSRQYPVVISAFLRDLSSGKDNLRPVWLLVSPLVEDLLASRLGWRTLSATAEQRVEVHNVKSVSKKERQAKKADLSIHKTGLGEPVPEEVKTLCEERIAEWKQNRKGKQAHITEVRPWVGSEHRRYLWATDKNGTIQGLIVLHRLAPRHGFQMKFALDFPGSPSGCIEELISQSLQTLASSGVQDVTFGVGAMEDIEFSGTLEGTMRAKMLRRTYKTVVEQLKLAAKSEFREKFGAEEDRLFICYPPFGLGVSGVRTIIKFFEDDM